MEKPVQVDSSKTELPVTENTPEVERPVQGVEKAREPTEEDAEEPDEDGIAADTEQDTEPKQKTMTKEEAMMDLLRLQYKPFAGKSANLPPLKDLILAQRERKRREELVWGWERSAPRKVVDENYIEGVLLIPGKMTV
jgi:hypothetical protein